MNIIKHYDTLASLYAGLSTLASAAGAMISRQRPPECRSAFPSCVEHLGPRQCAGKPLPSKKTWQHAKGAAVVSLTLVSAALMTFAPGVATAQTIDNPPLMPMILTVFPERDFVSVEGFAKNADVLIQVRRNGLVSDAVGRTDATGTIEVNHPGGVCWRNVTPDIFPGDTIRVTYQDTKNNRTLVPIPLKDSGAALNTQNIKATQAFDNGDGTVVVKGSAVLPGGGRIPLNRLEVRIVNPDFIDPLTSPSRITKRDIRVDSTGGRIGGIPEATATLTYDSATSTTFTAVFMGLNDFERQLAVEGQTRVLGWQQTTAGGDRLGMTIYEVGEVGGPGFGGCPPGSNPASIPSAKDPSTPVPYDPTQLVNAADQGSQSLLKIVTVFPERDFVSIEGFPVNTDLQVVVRRGTGEKPVIGTARGIVGRSGIFEINHPGGVCWTGQTPDIRPGDMVDVFVVYQGGFSSGQTQQVIDAKVTKAAFINANGEIRVNGTAIKDLVPLPLRFMEQRIINPDFVNTRIGRRDIRADNAGGRIDNVPGGTGSLLRTGDNTSIEWRAVYTGLNDAEKQIAIAGQSRAMAWLSTNANGDRFGLTISEFGEVGGPGMGGCPSTGSASIAIR